MTPDPKTSCGPYHPKALSFVQNAKESMTDKNFGKTGNHDTIGMVALDKNGKIAAGTSTNGASFKIPGYYTFNVSESYLDSSYTFSI